MENLLAQRPRVLTADDYRSCQPAHLRARSRLAAAGAAGIDNEFVEIERSLRAAVRRGDELAETELLFLRARNLSMHAVDRASAAYDVAMENAERRGNRLWKAITLVQRAHIIIDSAAKLESLWNGVRILEGIEGAGIHLVRAQLSLAEHCVHFDREFAATTVDEIDVSRVDLGPFESNLLGSLCRELGRFEQALGWFERTRELVAVTHPVRVPFALLGAAVVHADMGNHALAAECCRRALEYDDSQMHRPRSILELARALQALGSSADAKRVLLDFVDNPGTESQTRARRAVLSMLASFVVESAPDEAIAYLSRGVALPDTEADAAEVLDDKRRLVALLRENGPRDEYDACVTEYLRMVEIVDEENRRASSERHRAALDLHRLRASLDVQKLEAERRGHAAEYTTRELARQAATTAALTGNLEALKTDLMRVLDGGDTLGAKLSDIRKIVDRQAGHELGMQSLEVAFRQINPEWCATLVARHPDLTKEETRICMLLRMRLSSADIARYLNRSPRSVENHRFRIRRKLDLEPTDSLSDALSAFS